jgi:hypothetical protein
MCISEHIMSCMMQSRMLEERQTSKDVDCGICYEKTVEKGRRFGLLSMYLFFLSPLPSHILK